jgi:hypothetical protein
MAPALSLVLFDFRFSIFHFFSLCRAQLSMIEIPLFQQDEPLRVERVVLYPYPDLIRVWTRIWLSAAQEEEKPNLEIMVLNPSGEENCSVYMLEHGELRAETTLHMRNPQPGATYKVLVDLTRGLGSEAVQLDHHEFDLTLEFHNPDRGEPGYGFGVDWEDVKRKAQGL